MTDQSSEIKVKTEVEKESKLYYYQQGYDEALKYVVEILEHIPSTSHDGSIYLKTQILNAISQSRQVNKQVLTIVQLAIDKAIKESEGFN